MAFSLEISKTSSTTSRLTGFGEVTSAEVKTYIADVWQTTTTMTYSHTDGNGRRVYTGTLTHPAAASASGSAVAEFVVEGTTYFSVASTGEWWAPLAEIVDPTTGFSLQANSSSDAEIRYTGAGEITSALVRTYSSGVSQTTSAMAYDSTDGSGRRIYKGTMTHPTLPDVTGGARAEFVVDGVTHVSDTVAGSWWAA